jgi:pimeloyl-ACP methyl ester carboxylesterase
VAIAEHTEDIDGQPIFWRTAPGPDPPVLYLHGVPDSSDSWLPFLERTGGIAPDLPGFGRSAKRGDFDYSIPGYDRWLERFLDHVGVERFRLVMHDWGALGLRLAQRQPERVERFVLSNAVPFLPGYRWHWAARTWRRRGLGELAMGTTTRWGLTLLSRQASGTPGPMPREFLDAAWSHFDQGTQRAILRLYRSAPEDVLAAAGRDLGRIAAPGLVVWGADDPYLPSHFADLYAQALGDTGVRHVPGAGHWPWIDQPALVDEMCEFIAGARVPE